MERLLVDMKDLSKIVEESEDTLFLRNTALLLIREVKLLKEGNKALKEELAELRVEYIQAFGELQGEGKNPLVKDG